MLTPGEAPAPHGLVAGVAILRENSVLAVYERDRWGLPRDGSEPGEFFFEAIVREATEEIGVKVEIQSLVFTSEVHTPDYRIYLQRFYHTMPAADNPTPSPSGSDDGIEVAEFLPLTALGLMLIYRPRVEPLRDWFRNRRPRHYAYDPTREPSGVEK